MKKISVGILGATGMVGQQYFHLLKNHPWFEITYLASSEQSAGKTYEQATIGRWHQQEPLDDPYKNFLVHSIEDIETCKKNCRFVFSAITSHAAKLYEEKYAAYGLPVISNASYHRNTVDVPILIPEINQDHLAILDVQKKSRGWNTGFIVVKPNCSIQSYMIPLHPLHEKFRVKKLFVTTMQAVSGAGYPGVSSLDIHDNIIPFIDGEESKSENEPLKVWGKISKSHIQNDSAIKLSVHCNRVSVLDGHMAAVSVEFENKPTKEEILSLWKNYKNLELPSAPKKTIIYLDQQDRPQPRLDRMQGKGMAVTVGRLRDCPLFHYRFTALSHNTIRGAAGGGILNAELLYTQGYIPS